MMRQWQSLGKHRISALDDVVCLEVHGAVSLDEIRQFYEQAERMLVQHRWVGLVVDVRNAGLPTPEARRYIADWERRNPGSEGVAIFYGVSSLLVTMGRLIFHAVKMLTPRRSSRGPFFVTSEAEALALLQDHRPAKRSTGANREKEY